MKIRINLNQNIKELDLDASALIEDVKALIEVELGIPYTEQLLKFNSISLVDDKTLSFYNIKNNDMIMVSKVPFYNPLTSSFVNQNLMNEALQMKAEFENNPNDLQYILHQNPELAQAVLSDDINVLMNYIAKIKQKKMQDDMKKFQEINALNSDPMNPENQRKIEEVIQMKNIDENLHLANEFMPENFGTVTMLYIDISINKFPIQAFVDSGAQSTIMSKKCAERCGIMRLVDKRYAGTALGVGQARIMGRIHAIDMQIGNKFITCSLTILEDDKIDFLFGLDMLKRHECKIDLKKNVLAIGDGLIEVPFLSEGEIKKSMLSAFLEQEEEKKFEEQLIKEAIDNSKNEANKPLQHQNKPPQSVNKPQNIPPAQPFNIPAQTHNLPINQSLNNNNNNNRGNVGYREEDVKKLTDLSFSREAAIRALRATGGNVDQAASLLFQESGTFF